MSATANAICMSGGDSGPWGAMRDGQRGSALSRTLVVASLCKIAGRKKVRRSHGDERVWRVERSSVHNMIFS